LADFRHFSILQIAQNSSQKNLGFFIMTMNKK